LDGHPSTLANARVVTLLADAALTATLAFDVTPIRELLKLFTRIPACPA
jgi:hypothetical protein